MKMSKALSVRFFTILLAALMCAMNLQWHAGAEEIGDSIVQSSANSRSKYLPDTAIIQYSVGEAQFASATVSVGKPKITSALLHYAQAAITVSPNVVETGTTPEITISAGGTFDLSVVSASQISIRPSQGVSDFQIKSATAQHLRFTFRLAEDAATGVRTLLIKNKGQTVVALDINLTLRPGICQPSCSADQVCRNNVCVRAPGCHPDCERPLVCGTGEFPVCVMPRCIPACDENATPPQFCNTSFSPPICEDQL